MKAFRFLLAGLLAAVSAPAFSAITSIGPFSGSFHEDYEGFPPQDVQIFLPNPTAAFAGQGILSTDVDPGLAVYGPPNHVFGNFLPTDGVQYAVTQQFGLTTRFEFSTALKDFGGYWSSVNQDGSAAELHLEFLNSAGLSVGSGDYQTVGFTNDGILPWIGWNSDVAFSAVQVTSTGLVLFDSTEANPVPEPMSILAIAGGLVATLRRKKNQK